MNTNQGQQDQPVLGMIHMCLGLMLMPVMDGAAKYLTSDLAAVEVAWWRFALQWLMLLPILSLAGLWRYAHWHSVGWQMLPGVLLALDTACFFYALQFMSMAKAVTIFFVEPLIVTLLAAVFLRERLKLRRIIAIIIGFIGMWVVIRPYAGQQMGWQAEWYTLLPLLAATFFAGYFLLLRRVARHTHPIMTQWHVASGAIITLSILMLLPYSGLPIKDFALAITPKGAGWDHAWLLLVMSSVAIVGHGFMISATAKAPANLLAPMAYIEILGAVTFGYIVFAEVPDHFTLIGGAIIVASGLYLIYREQQLRRQGLEVRRSDETISMKN